MNEDRKHVMAFEAKSCTGCSACEIACSFHHRKEFSRELSSIRITESPSSPKKMFEVSFFLKGSEKHLACDLCEGLDVPLCVKYCNVLMRDELKTLVDQVTQRRRE
jgi:Fe-S-cluster-containing dehydrogenase component